MIYFLLKNYVFEQTNKQNCRSLINAIYTLNFKLFLSEENMESLLEQQRRYHEERERLTDALVQVTDIAEGLSSYFNLMLVIS